MTTVKRLRKSLALTTYLFLEVTVDELKLQVPSINKLLIVDIWHDAGKLLIDGLSKYFVCCQTSDMVTLGIMRLGYFNVIQGSQSGIHGICQACRT